MNSHVDEMYNVNSNCNVGQVVKLFVNIGTLLKFIDRCFFFYFNATAC